jgi:hypothetical protein
VNSNQEPGFIEEKIYDCGFDVAKKVKDLQAINPKAFEDENFEK